MRTNQWAWGLFGSPLDFFDVPRHADQSPESPMNPGGKSIPVGQVVGAWQPWAAELRTIGISVTCRAFFARICPLKGKILVLLVNSPARADPEGTGLEMWAFACGSSYSRPSEATPTAQT